MSRGGVGRRPHWKGHTAESRSAGPWLRSVHGWQAEEDALPADAQGPLSPDGPQLHPFLAPLGAPGAL